MDEIRKKLLLVFDQNKYLGLLSIGDLQRSIISSVDLGTPIHKIIRKDYISVKPNTSIEDVKKLMLSIRAEFMPVVTDGGELLEVHFWEDLFGSFEDAPVKQFKLPIVIMAGGFGTRLKPLTNVLPKPLLPIGKKTILEEIFDRFGKHGCDQFFISVNYKADLIEYYLRSQNLPYSLEFFKEEKPLGTAGSLTLLKGKIDQTFVVSNCDILIDQDYSEILDYHKNCGNEITIIAALKHYPIPYGIIKTGENGKLIDLKEKPELTFKINSGMYILESHLLDEIPENEFFHITQLVEKIKNRNGNIGVFPVTEKSWKDVGLLSEYIDLLKQC
ncbi:NTP transferase domain-containing protein [Arcticibacter tournemirensis]|uniref:NTP transferase domain-containing protein n=2 Tax=Arcticibacter tournemirensis TaxID=699437 RepID=A0A5M9HDC4_9SPHI|nr:NTP transferase domain-containing protein [Arcticibacter tournemirensis]